MERAADGFAELGDAELELVALLQLGYVARMSGDAQRLSPIIERAVSLAEHYPPARPFLAFGDAWTALAEGRPDRQLAAMETIVDADLPLVWQRSRDHLIAHALFNLGRPDEGLERAPRMDESISIPIPGALVTHSQCLWWSGRPEAALAARPLGLDARHGARDRFIAGGWIAMMETWAGRLAEAQAARRIAATHAGEVPAAIVSFQMAGLDILHLLVSGDEAAAAEQLAALLELVPLGDGVSEQALRNLISLPYVLVPASRDYWDTVELGPSIDRSREIARGLVEAAIRQPRAGCHVRMERSRNDGGDAPCSVGHRARAVRRRVRTGRGSTTRRVAVRALGTVSA